MRGFVALCLGVALVAPLSAHVDDVSVTTVRNVNLHPTTEAEVQRTLAKLDGAALRVCGGSEFSLREYKTALRDSSCWRGAMEDATRQIASPALAQAFARYQAAP